MSDRSVFQLKKIIFLYIVLVFTSMAYASNNKREQEYANIIKTTLKTGEVLWLEAQGRKFLTIYTETVQKNNLGVAIILHDRSAYPDQQYLIHDLRTVLPQHNWATLSVQMPVREVGAEESEYFALFKEADARIVSAISYLQQTEAKNIILIGYGLGAMMAVYTASENSDVLNAIVAISLAVPETQHKQLQIISFINKIQIPFLDIYAEYDLLAVLETARERKLAAKQNTDFRQFKLAGAEHSFQYNHDLIVKRIYSWLTRTFRKQ